MFKIEVLHLDGKWYEAGKLARLEAGHLAYPVFASTEEAEEVVKSTYPMPEHEKCVRIVPVMPSYMAQQACRDLNEDALTAISQHLTMVLRYGETMTNAERIVFTQTAKGLEQLVQWGKK